MPAKARLMATGTVLLAAFTVAAQAEEKVTANEAPASLQREVDLAPMSKPRDRDVGFKWFGVGNDGQEVVVEVIAKDSDTTTFRDNTGCRWVSRLGSWFGGALEWSGCGGTGGRRRTDFPDEADIWPLSVGRSWSYYEHGRNDNGNRWEGRRRCEVAGTATFKLEAGLDDTFKVVCNDPWSRHTYYVSPAHQTTVRFERVNKRHGTTWSRQFRRLEHPSGS